jgi:hypothetical protein
MYIYYKCQEQMARKKVYLHPGHSDEAFIKFINENWDHSKESMEDDAEAWDTNVNAACIRFQFYLLDYYGIPRDLAERFKLYKTNMHSLHTAIKFMMFSGGPDTLPFNTILCAVLQELRCEIPLGTPRIHGGDDVSINSKVRFSSWWLENHKLIPQVFKPVSTYHPCCFGWRIYPIPHKDPKTTLARYIYSEGTSRLSRTIRGLLADTQHFTPECILQMDPEDQMYAQACVSLATKYRIKYHASMSGVSEHLKRGAVKRYSLENNAMFNPNL